MKTIPVAIAVVCAWLLVGCAGGESTVSQVLSDVPAATETPIETADVAIPAAGFGLPSPSQIRASSFIEEDLYRVGSDTVETVAPQRTLPSGDLMLFTPNWHQDAPVNTGLSYAPYQFLLDGYDRDETARFVWSDSADFGDGWVALANWQRNAWNWYQLPEGDILALEFDGCINPEDNSLLMVILFTGQDTWALDYVRIGAPPGAPQPPTNIQATKGEFLDKIVVSWDAPFGATGYLVYRNSQDLPVATLGDITTYDDFPEGTFPNFYWVIATNEDGPSGFSERGDGWCAVCLPPTDVSASDGLYANRIEVTWTKSESAQGYEVFRDMSEIPVAVIGDVDSWSDLGVVDSGSHYYAVQGFNIVGSSNRSPYDTGFLGSPVPPAVPTDLEASDGLFIDHIELTWTRAIDTIGYEIYRDLQALPITSVDDVDSWSDFTVIDNEPHTYWLKSVNASGTSDYSEPDTGHNAACDAPTDIEATDGIYANKIVVTWTKVAEAIGYKVFRDNQEIPITTLGDVDTYDDTTIVDSGVHAYWLKAFTATGDSAFSDWDTGHMRQLAIPTTPQNVQASDGTYIDRVEVTWDMVEDTERYYIYRDLQSAPIGMVGSELTTYDDTSLANYDPHEYWVKAWNSQGESGFSDSDTGYMGTPDTPPDPPTDLQASDGEFTDKIRLTWTASAGATGYKIFRDDQATPIDTVGNVTSYDDTGVSDFNERTYWLKAVNIVGDSGFSASDTGFRSIEGSAPDPPAGLQASDGTYVNKIELTWTKSPGATGYRIYRDLQSLPIAIVGDINTWDDTGVADIATHTYWLKATNDSGFSAFSVSDTGYLQAP